VPNLETKVGILSDLYSNYREDKGFREFVEYNDLGLPLAYFLNEGLALELSVDAVRYIEETWELFFTSLGVKEEDIPDGMTLDELLAMSLGDLE
jgi:hypothetical protein